MNNNFVAIHLVKLKPDFVIMNTAMPNSDGLFGLEHIKKIDSNASVIILTGNSDKSITQNYMIRAHCSSRKTISC